MRELSTDRPDKTESPYTVDAGHYQFEANLASAKHPGSGENQLHLESLAEMNAKVGLTPSADLQLVFVALAGRSELRDSDGGPTHGLPLEFLPGELTIRLKQNLLGNNGSGLGLAIMPYATWDDISGTGDLSEVGIILPCAGEATFGWSWGSMLVWAKDVTTSNGAHRGILSGTIGRGIVGDLRGYLELFAEGAEWSRLTSTFDAGMTLGFGENWQLDFGCNAGISTIADDWQPFIGLTARY